MADVDMENQGDDVNMVVAAGPPPAPIPVAAAVPAVAAADGGAGGGDGDGGRRVRRRRREPEAKIPLDIGDLTDRVNRLLAQATGIAERLAQQQARGGDAQAIFAAYQRIKVELGTQLQAL